MSASIEEIAAEMLDADQADPGNGPIGVWTRHPHGPIVCDWLISEIKGRLENRRLEHTVAMAGAVRGAYERIATERADSLRGGS